MKWRSHPGAGSLPGLLFLGCVGLICASSCRPATPAPDDELVARGRDLFFDEAFDGNGRTCGSCHPASNNFTIDPAFAVTLPAGDPLFAAEFDAGLGQNFENPTLMREVGLILENQDGFGDLENDFNMRGVPHTLGLGLSIDSRDGPRSGWSGDGAPGDGSLRSFATGAVIQHFPRTLGRVPGEDFRLPTDEELDALEAFQLSLGRQEELTLPLPLKGRVASRGQEIFNDATLGKCSACHFNAGANGDPGVFGAGAGNLNFNTGVEDLPDQPADLTGEPVPPDDGLGTPGDGTFNTPSLVEAADTGPFFHNNSVETIEGAVVFYNGDAFNNSPAGQLLAGATGGGINLDATQVVEVAAFLRVINTLENIRQSIGFLISFAERRFAGNEEFDQLLARALDETDDGIGVLVAGGLHPVAVAHLREARRLTTEAMESWFSGERLAREAAREQELARDELVGL
jgi:mono/diheme cytochrome c family protein